MGAVDNAILTIIGAKVFGWVFGRLAGLFASEAAAEAPLVVEQIAGFYVRGSTSVADGVYAKTIQSLASLENNTSVLAN